MALDEASEETQKASARELWWWVEWAVLGGSFQIYILQNFPRLFEDWSIFFKNFIVNLKQYVFKKFKW